VSLNSNEEPTISCRDGRWYVAWKTRIPQIVKVREFELQVASVFVVRVIDLSEDVFSFDRFDDVVVVNLTSLDQSTTY
jgi:hypothetical protein